MTLIQKSSPRSRPETLMSTSATIIRRAKPKSYCQWNNISSYHNRYSRSFQEDAVTSSLCSISSTNCVAPVYSDLSTTSFRTLSIRPTSAAMEDSFNTSLCSFLNIADSMGSRGAKYVKTSAMLQLYTNNVYCQRIKNCLRNFSPNCS